jgi:thioredoxin-dependent peroxiredoxin
MEREGIVAFDGNPLTLIGPELKEGEKAPDFVVLDKAMKEVTLRDFGGKIKVISVTPSIDTPVCHIQAMRFNQEAQKLPDTVVILNVSMDLPFAIERFCASEHIEKAIPLSDHRDASFGNSYGLLIKNLRLLARAIFVIDRDDIIRYVEIVPQLTNHPDYEKALEAVKKLLP